MASMRSDGGAVEVVLSKSYAKDDVVLEQGFHGIAMEDGVAGQTIAIEIAQREHEVNVGGVAAAKGAVLYLTSAGAVSASATGNRPFLKVTVAKDANNIVWGILLPQSA